MSKKSQFRPVAWATGIGLGLAAASWGGPPLAKKLQVNFASLADRSSIILRGTVVKTSASEEPLQAASNQTVVIKVSEVYIGEDITGKQVGRLATVILSRAMNAPVGADLMFFGTPKFIGKSLTIADIGEMSAREAVASKAPFEAAIQGRRDLPLRLALREANQVFRGRVEKIEPIGKDNEKLGPATEHDPEWRLATVRVTNEIRGPKEGTMAKVLFASSRDIIWYASPKLKEGEQGIFITRKAKEEESAMMRETGALEMLEQMGAQLLIHSASYQPIESEPKVRALADKEMRG